MVTVTSNTKIKIKGLIIFFLVFQGINLYAQRPTSPEQHMGNQQQGMDMSQNVAQINVDDLSDDQIRQYVRAAQERGVSQEQVEAGLRQRGMSEIQVQKLRTRIQNLGRETRSMYFESEKKDEERQSLPSEDHVINILQTKDFEKIQEQKFRSRIFGSSLFGNPSLTFEPSFNMPTPSNYRIGPGDELIIDIWGASEANFIAPVTPEGYIRIRNLGPVYVNGFTVEVARERIIGRLSSIFSGLKGTHPSTFAQVNLGNVRRVKVSIIGEVVQPGTYTVSSLSTIFNALNVAGGPTANGSFREIQVIRNNKTVATIDLYQFLITGEQANNIRLEDQDIIRVGPYLHRIQLTGEKKRLEDLYELKPDENMADLINFAGGFTDKAFTHQIKVRRNTLKERRIIDVSHDQFGQFPLIAGDMINIEPILDRFENRVQIAGAVFREGEFELCNELTVKQLIIKAEGLRGDAFLERATIYRTKDDFSTEVVAFNIREVMNGANDIALQREDLVKISSIYDLNEEYFIEIKGEVRIPGVFPYMQNMTIEDLIMVGGGLMESASNSRVEVVRRFKTENISTGGTVAEVSTFNISKNLRMEEKDLNFTLRPFDMIFVRKSPGYQVQQIAQVAGEVLYPGTYGIKHKTERISDLIKRTGGLTDEAFINGATLLRRTEYNTNNINESYAGKINELKNRNHSISGAREQFIMTESEYFRNQRLARLDNNLRENDTELIYENKRHTMSVLGARDSLLKDTDTRQMDAIGIDLAEILRNPGSKHDLILEDGDILNIPKELQTVRLRGELLYPITVRYDRSNSFSNYVSRAGGYSSHAKKNKAYVVYANGSVDRTRSFLFFKNYPDIEPGAEIIIPSKPERGGLSTQETVGLATGAATLSYLVITIINSLSK
jgi:protein involved in polysaccharide export with SLBB domain